MSASNRNSAVGAYDYTPHPKALMMPELSESQFKALKAGIADHGLQHAIKVLKGTNLLLDGRHRLQACRELEYPIKVEEVELAEEDVPIYTGAEAAKRPSLSVSQKVVHAIKLLPEIRERAARLRLPESVGEASVRKEGRP
jgi:ParB-like chromosome segregation protein Spo0J